MDQNETFFENLGAMYEEHEDDSSSPFLKQFSTYFMFDEMGLKRKQFIERFQKSFLNFLTKFCQRQSGKEAF